MINIDIIFYAIVIIYVATTMVYGLYRGVYLKIVNKNTPILFLYYTMNRSFLPLHKIDKGDSRVYIYSSFNYTDGNTATMFLVHLPFKTKIHLLAITKRKDMSQFRIEKINSVMEPVLLEGDFHNFFTLYTEKGMQTDSRYVLDPKAMAFTMDFCKSHSWEIRGSEFYFVQENFSNVEGDTTWMWDDIDQFIKEIKPAVAMPLSEEELRIRNPYGSAVQHPDKIICPICATKLSVTSEEIYECINGHGCLLHGSDMLKLRNNDLQLKFANKSNLDSNHSTVKCPSCNTKMEKVKYAYTNKDIDICNNCQFRWIDSGELTKK
jgi:Zn-finger nucleic acid-binding protein